MGEKECVDQNFRLNSRCATFPLLFGVPEIMGYENSKDRKEKKPTFKKQWFIYYLSGCHIVENELFLQFLRWIVEELNSYSKKRFFFSTFGEEYLAIYLNNNKNK